MRTAQLVAGVSAVVTLLLVGMGTSSAGGATDSTINIDGTTTIAVVKGNGTERGNNPLNASGYGYAAATHGQAPIFNGGGPLVCLDVRGNTAGAIVHLTSSTDPALVGRYADATFVDNGPDGVDRFGFVLLPTPSPTCAPVPAIAQSTFITGGVEIHDGTRHR